MCRFVAYLGNRSNLLSKYLVDVDNSLLQQSIGTKSSENNRRNADGAGIGWYTDKKTIKIFKTSKAASLSKEFINQSNLNESHCFIGHIRAATMGEVSDLNCHPFLYDKYLFAHNGTIFGFEDIKEQLFNILSGEGYGLPKGSTDSEYFFSLLIDKVLQQDGSVFLGSLNLIKNTILEINKIQKLYDPDLFFRLNAVLTNGKELLATRYVSNLLKESLTLFYLKQDSGVVVASEKLFESDDWQEVPINHALFINKNLEIKLIKI